jgi:carbon storage regulator CsrA
MLVLSRKVGERIHIGENITVEIRRIAGNRVTLALEAPRDVRILRGELASAAREFDGTHPAPANNAGGDKTNYAIASMRVNVIRDLPTQITDPNYVT